MLVAPEEVLASLQTTEIHSGAPGSPICLWQLDEIYGIASSVRQGRTKLEIDPSRLGCVDLTARAFALYAGLMGK